MKLRLHQFLPCSRANGPGARAVVWVQGCSLRCPGCFNLETHSLRRGEAVDVSDLVDTIVELGESIEGVTVSGGEPLQQRPAVTELLRRVNCETSLSVILFTGFGWKEVVRMGVSGHRSVGASERPSGRASERQSVQAVERQSVQACGPSGNVNRRKRSHAPTLPRSHAPPSALPEVLNYVDVLIAGRYDQSRRFARGLRGSSNKTVHFLTDRYTIDELESVPHAEVVVTRSGAVLFSGIDPMIW